MMKGIWPDRHLEEYKTTFADSALISINYNSSMNIGVTAKKPCSDSFPDYKGSHMFGVSFLSTVSCPTDVTHVFYFVLC